MTHPKTNPPANTERRGMDPSEPGEETWPTDGEPAPSKNRLLGGNMDQQPGRRFQEKTGKGVRDASTDTEQRDKS